MRAIADRRSITACTGKPLYYLGKGQWWVLWPGRGYADPCAPLPWAPA
jgi:hypothetical protein